VDPQAPLVVFLHSAGWAARCQAATVAVTAAALGDQVTVALAFEPLRLWTEGRFDEGAPPAAAGAKLGSLAGALDEARRELGLRVVACETLVRVEGLDPGAVAPALDELTTLPSLWRLAQAGRALAF